MTLEAGFGDEVKARIAEAVRRAESTSRGQIVPVVVHRSDAYPEVRYRGALLAAALATAAALLLPFPLALSELALAQIAAGLAGAGLTFWEPLERLLLGGRAMQEAVHARAVRAFHEHGLHKTAEGTGVLVFASLFEHRAVVLGDRGIHEKMGDGGWERALAALTAGMRTGAPGKGFEDAVALCGARLAEHFPRDPAARPQPNELDDALQVEER